MAGGWLTLGWQVFAAEPQVAAWVRAVAPVALREAAEPEARARWLRHGGTWFAGVDHLSNDAEGRVGAGPPLQATARAAAESVTGPLPLHPAQVSITYPGYPRRDPSEREAAFRYRLRRDAAHLDGLLPEGPERRRHLREPHGYILGIALTGADAGAAPLVVYEGSQEIMRAALTARLSGCAPETWGEADLTEAYQAARRACFTQCQRIEVPLRPGDCVLLHRLVLHGIAPWADGARADPAGRAIAYFRPLLRRVGDWLALA